MQNAKATIGGGCFWCVEAIFKRIEGVIEIYSGYAGGNKDSANYKDVCKGNTGHAECVQMSFDPNKLSYSDLLKVFFVAHDPTTINQQGGDVGHQYRSIIYYHDQDQKNTALHLIEQLNQSGYYKSKIVTEVVQYSEFFRAEKEHFDYFDLNPNQGYCKTVIAPKVSKITKEFNDRLKAGFKQ